MKKQMKEILLEARKNNKLTQEQLAEKINVSNKTISKWERGLSYPDVTIIPSLVKALNISINDLFETDDFNKDINVTDNNSKQISFKNKIILSILSIIIIPFLYILILLTDDPIINDIVYVVGFILLLLSIVSSIMTAVKQYGVISNTYYNTLLIKTFKKYIGLYLLVLSVPLLLLSTILEDIMISYILILIIELVFIIFNLTMIKVFNLNYKNKKILILFILLVMSVITGIILMLLNGLMPNIIYFIISQVINYLIILLSDKEE